MKKLFFAGLILAASGPAITLFGFAAHELMGCSGGGSSGPVSGCHIFGFEFNFFASLATPAFLLSFFAVPLGLLLCLIGAISAAFSHSESPPNKAIGVYYDQGNTLQLPVAVSAISKFDRDECNNLLGAFGLPVSSPPESLESARARCIAAIETCVTDA